MNDYGPGSYGSFGSSAGEMPPLVPVPAPPAVPQATVEAPAEPIPLLRREEPVAAGFKNRDEWSAPALIELRFDPDPRSATAIRQADPDWASRFAGLSPRDGVTHSLIHDPDQTRSKVGGQGA